MAFENGQNTDHPDNADNSPSSDEDFDAAFAEFVTEESDPAKAAAGTLSDDLPPDGAADSPAPAQAAANSEPTADAPASPAQAPTHDDNLWSKADSTLRQAHEDAMRDAELRFKAIQGRQSAADRENARLRKELERLRATVGGQTSSNADEGDDEGEGRDSPVSDSLRQLQEDYPEVAGPLLNEIEALKAKLTQLSAPVETLAQQQQRAAIEAQENLLTQQHPDWPTVARDDRFFGWLEGQPQAIKDAMQRNFNAIVDGQEAALVIGKFKADLGIAAKPSAPDVKPTSLTAHERRQRQLQSGRDAGGKTGPSVTTGIPDDFDAAVDVFMPRG